MSSNATLKKSWLLIFAALLLLNAAILTEIILYSHNTPYINDNWIVVKRTHEMDTSGGDEFLLSRLAFAQNVLDLGAWYGYQELILKNHDNLTAVKADFNIPQQSYLDIIFERSPEGFSGLRINTLKDQKSYYFTADPQGKFIQKNNMDLHVPTRGWHKLYFFSTEKDLRLRIDENPEVVVRSTPIGFGQIGFHTGEVGVLLDNISFFHHGKLKFHEDFRHTENWRGIFIYHFAILFFIFSLPILFIYNHRQKVLQYQTLFTLVFAICTSSYLATDYFHFSKIPFPQWSISVFDWVGPSGSPFLENLRVGVTNKWGRAVGIETSTVKGLALRGYPEHRTLWGPFYCGPSTGHACRLLTTEERPALFATKKTFRILLMGTSQSYGSAAHTFNESFFVLLHKNLLPHFKNQSLESLNMSIRGSNSAELFKEYKENFIQFQPDLVLADLTNNDTVESLKTYLPEIIKLNQSLKIKTLLIKEPISLEEQGQFITTPKQDAYMEIAKQFNVPVLPLHEYLNTPDITDSGFLWSDYVHLSSYGQKLTADWLTQQIVGHL